MIPKASINADELARLRAKGVQVSYPGLSPKAAQVADGIAAAEPLRRKSPWQQKHKFNAKRVTLDGIKFPSLAEGQYYEFLKLKQQAGDLIFFLMQISFRMPGDPTPIIYKLDFMEFWANGEIKFIDVKGFQTPEFRLKRRMVQAYYPIKIQCVKMLKAGPRYEDET